MTDRDVYLQHRHDITRFAAVLVGPDDASDVVSTVVTRLLGSGRSLTDLDNPKAYLMQAVLNEARTVLRRRQRSMTAAMRDVPTKLDARVDLEVMEAVAGLPVRQRAVTFLTYWVGMTSTEIGQMLKMKPGTVRRYLHLARKRLREVLDDDR